jgi:hypothetical protein
MLCKTEKGHDELRPGVRNLSQRERAILLLVEVPRNELSIARLFGGEGEALIDRLLHQGYLTRDLAPVLTRSAAPVTPRPTAPAQTARVEAAPPVSAPATSGIHGDPFTGTRSLATARMFLFDLSERLFAPSDKALAARYREALRGARDAVAMLAVGREMIVDVEVLAGSERADGISERLAKLLPVELLETMGQVSVKLDRSGESSPKREPPKAQATGTRS